MLVSRVDLIHYVFITFRTKVLLHLGPLLHLGTFITFEASTGSSVLVSKYLIYLLILKELSRVFI